MSHVGFEVLTAATVHSGIFWAVTPCTSVVSLFKLAVLSYPSPLVNRSLLQYSYFRMPFVSISLVAGRSADAMQ
jgi:hypothetical protein